MNIEMRPVGDVRPYEQNPRLNDGAVAAVARSLKEFGFRQPIVVDVDGVIVVGHTRFKAAQQLGMKEVPVHVAKDLTPEQAKAYRLADNQTAQLAEWDMKLLPLEIGELEALDYDLSVLGWSPDELAEILAPPGTDGLVDADEVPEPPTEATTTRGDVYVLGRHRLLCGDSTDAGDVLILLDGATPQIMVTDPPYGVEYDPKWRAEAGINKNKDKMGSVANDDRADWTEAWKLFCGDVAYVYHAGVFSATVQHSLEQAGFNVRAQIIWAKDRMALSRGDYHWQHEPCWYAVREGKPGLRTDDRTQTTLWSIPSRDDGGHGHGTQKPVECMERPIRNHTASVVYDPFSGSGTTMIACERLGKTCLAMELEPRYCDVIVQRWETFTGKKAELRKLAEKGQEGGT